MLNILMNYFNIEPLNISFRTNKKILINNIIIKKVRHINVEINTCGEHKTKIINFLASDGTEVGNYQIPFAHEVEISEREGNFIKVKSEKVFVNAN